MAKGLFMLLVVAAMTAGCAGRQDPAPSRSAGDAADPQYAGLAGNWAGRMVNNVGAQSRYEVTFTRVREATAQGEWNFGGFGGYSTAATGNAVWRVEGQTLVQDNGASNLTWDGKDTITGTGVWRNQPVTIELRKR